MSRLAATDLHMTLRRAALLLVALSLSGCERTWNLASSRDSADGGGSEGGLDAQVEERDAGSMDSGPSRDASSEAGGSVGVPCGTHICACSDNKDNDGDGMPDGFDSECTGPYDDYEDSFRVNDVNEGNPNCADCFYDDNPGFDDGCKVSSHCSVDGMPSNGGGCGTCTAEPMCINSCVPRTPNGCDCFGCCEVSHGGVTVPIRLVSSCTVEKIADEKACPRCVLAKDCMNPCENCEICPGKTLAELPTWCGGENTCSTGTPCDGPNNCQLSEYCSQGCCVPIVL